MARVIALAGNPNCGKTTLFNALTGANQHVGNWPGVTVERRAGQLLPRFGSAEVVDLPGLYSLFPWSMEEQVSAGQLTNGNADVIVNVADATRPSRSLYLTLQLLELGKPVVVALNLMDEARRTGVTYDLPRLERALGVPVVPISARRGEGLTELMQTALNEAGRAPRPTARASVPTASAEDECARVIERYRFIDDLAAVCVRREPRVDLTERLDRMLAHPVCAYPIFAAAMATVFFVAFGPLGAWAAETFGRILDAGLALMNGALLRWQIAEGLRALVVEGALRGVSGVLRFLPTLLLLLLMLSLLEDSGYMARAAFLMDRPLRRLGLNGRSFLPLMLGFGCTVPAVMSARAMNDRRERIRTVLLTPLMSCGAKTPVYALLGDAFFPGCGGLVTTALYAAGVLTAAAVGGAMRRFSGEASPYLMELPPYRWPTLTGMLRQMQQRAGDFIRRAFTVVFLATLAVWALRRFTPTFAVARAPEESWLGLLAGWLAPAFAPAGFGNASAVAALLTGWLAKESVVSTLLVLESQLTACFPTALSAASFLLFTLLYAPCAAACAAMRHELESWRLALMAVLGQTALAWLAATALYQLGSALS